MLVTTSHKKVRYSYKIISAFLGVIASLIFLSQAYGDFNANYSSSIQTGNGDPARITMDNSGTLYVATPGSGKVLKFSQDGKPIGSINGFIKPVSVAVDNTYRVYVGDFGNGSVTVFTSVGGGSGGGSYSLGIGKGEFSMPGSIAVASNGNIYVTDSFRNIVKVYSPNGTFKFSFGGYGTSPGQMIYPTGIAVDNANQEIYVVDHNNARVQVFDFNGVFKRTFGSYGSDNGMLTRPQGISVVNGYVYVADAFQSSVEVFDRNGNFIAVIGQYGSGQGEMKTPLDVVKKGGKLYVSNSDNERIEVFNVTEQQGLIFNPAELSFGTSVNSNPPAQTVNITSAVQGSQIQWTATVTSPFTIRLSKTSGSTPSDVMVSPIVTGLPAGTYKGTVNFRANGIDYPLTVNLSIQQQQQVQLFVSPTTLAYSYPSITYGGGGGGSQTIKKVSITSSVGGLQWTATTDVQWLTLSPSSGSTPSSLSVSLNQGVKSLTPGTYPATVTITAPDALGSPVTIAVTLKVSASVAVAVNTNIEKASFTMTGPAQYSGSGKSWKKEGVLSGAYSIQFNAVKGFRKPASTTFIIGEGRSNTHDALYQELPVANAIVAAKGPDPNNDSLVRILDLKGTVINEFKALDTMYGARVAAGDVTGDGSGQIFVTPGPGPDNKAFLRVFRADGSLITSLGPFSGTAFGATIAVGDIHGDGRYGVALGMAEGSSQTVVLYRMDNSYQFIEKARLDIPNSNPYPAPLAFGDIDGDGRLELMVSWQGGVDAFAIDEDFLPAKAALSPLPLADGRIDAYNGQMTVASGDANGDGMDALILGYSDGLRSLAGIFSQGTQEGMIKVSGGNTAPTLSSMDWDGDGSAEILAGNGPLQNNESVLRVYSSTGALLREMKAFDNSYYGVNGVFGVINASGSVKR